ncbi:MAG: hypothetical protein QOH84_4547, partial [Kribbellaceae bacterium]|nr:hypothetical protein [Kribbellaceae bacterium]
AYESAGGSSTEYWEIVEAAGIESPDIPAGENFDFDDDSEMEARYPLLAGLQDS